MEDEPKIEEEIPAEEEAEEAEEATI